MKKAIICLIYCIFTVNLFAQEIIDKSEYRDIGDGQDMSWEISQVSLRVGELVTWTSTNISISGDPRWINVWDAGTGLSAAIDKNWRVRSRTPYRLYGRVTRVDANYDGRPRARIDIIHLEEIPQP